MRLLLTNPEADSVRGVVPAGQNPHKMWRIDLKSGQMHLLDVPGLAEPYNAPRQALPPFSGRPDISMQSVPQRSLKKSR